MSDLKVNFGGLATAAADAAGRRSSPTHPASSSRRVNAVHSPSPGATGGVRFG